MVLKQIKEDAKVAVEWYNCIANYINNKKWLINLLLILLIILIIVPIYLYLKGFIVISSNKPTMEDFKKIDASATFFMYDEGLKVNKTYEVELTIKSNEKIKTISRMYMIPSKAGNQPPLIKNYSGECDFFEKSSCEIKAKIYTSNADEGDYKLCVLTSDKANLEREFNNCYTATKTVTS